MHSLIYIVSSESKNIVKYTYRSMHLLLYNHVSVERTKSKHIQSKNAYIDTNTYTDRKNNTYLRTCIHT